MPSSPTTVDELVATLARSQIPTVVVEGVSDMKIFRWMEAQLKMLGVDFFPCGGRSNLLQLLNRKTEFSRLQCTFVADRDMYYFTAIPQEFSTVIWTTGYSIENDALATAAMERLFTTEESALYSKALDSVIEWFAFEVTEHFQGRDAQIDIHPARVVDLATGKAKLDFLQQRGFCTPRADLLEKIRTEHKFALRGKSWLSLLACFFARREDGPKHSKDGLLEMALKIGPEPTLLLSIITAIKLQLSAPEPPVVLT